jgi:adenylate cyclase class IV
VEVEKTVFTDDEFEVVIEDVKNLGLFIEVEYHIADDKEDIEEAKNHIRKWLSDQRIKIGEEMNSGKPELMLQNDLSTPQQALH